LIFLESSPFLSISESVCSICSKTAAVRFQNQLFSSRRYLLTASPGSVLFSRSNNLLKRKRILLVPQARPY
jgi:hypothetical protein